MESKSSSGPKTKYRPRHADGHGARYFDSMTEAALFILDQPDSSAWSIKLETVADCDPDAQTLADFDRRDNTAGCNL